MPYGEGKKLITDLCGLAKDFEPKRYYECLKRAQKFSVNVFPNVWRKLQDQNAVIEIHSGEGVYYIDERYYSQEFGLSTEPVGKTEVIIM